MSSYRDDRLALRHRLEQLERELAEVRDEDKRAEVRQEVARLAELLTAATTKLEQDRSALDTLREGIEKLQRSVGVPEAEPEDEPEKADVEPKTGETPARLEVDASVRKYLPLFGGAVLLLVIIGVIANQSSSGSKPKTAQELASATIPDYPRVDPLALLPLAEARSKVKGHLVSIEAHYVSSDGRVDLSAADYPSSIVYTFGQQPPKPAAPTSAPLGAPQPSGPPASQAKVEVGSTGIRASDTALFMAGEAVREPNCTFQQIWSAAQTAGAPAEAVAIITYEQGLLSSFKRGPVWKFEIRGTSHSFTMNDDNCQVGK